MPSIQQIIDYVDRKYPNSETVANKVTDLNDIHIQIFVKIARLKNDFQIYETQTIANQLTYSLPTDCTIDNIIAAKVSRDTSVSANTKWDDYEYAGLNTDVTTGHYYSSAGGRIIALLADDKPIATDGLSIRIFYYRSPNALSSSNMADIPELDADYHDLLKYGLIQELASQGHNPDTEIADYWQAKYDELIRAVEDNLSDKFNKNPTESNQCKEWW
jgi:hypothetical protein